MKKTSQLKLLPQVFIEKINTNEKDQSTQTPPPSIYRENKHQ